MFETKSNYEWDVPELMRESESMYWRMLSLTWTMPWFVVSIEWQKSEQLQTFLVGSDMDLVSALVSVNGRGTLAFLACCVPTRHEGMFAWSMLDLAEVWLGSRFGEEFRAPVCVDLKKRQFSGVAFEPAPEIALDHLVARVGEVVQGKRGGA